MSQKVYESVTQTIIQMMETAGSYCQLPWYKGAMNGLSYNVASQKPYRGVNVFLLMNAELGHGFGSHVWGTYKQWKSAGAQVRKDERSTFCIYYQMIEKQLEEDSTDEDAKTIRFPMLKQYPLFNADQVEGWTDPNLTIDSEEAKTIDLDRRVQTMIDQHQVDIRFKGARAYFSPSRDMIAMPDSYRFEGRVEAYHAVLLHEMGHWTGHPKRLNRDISHRFGDDGYAFEELVAELSSAYLCASLCISAVPRDDHAAYLNSWIKQLKKDPKVFFKASKLATQAAEYLQQDPALEVAA